MMEVRNLVAILKTLRPIASASGLAVLLRVILNILIARFAFTWRDFHYPAPLLLLPNIFKTLSRNMDYTDIIKKKYNLDCTECSHDIERITVKFD